MQKTIKNHAVFKLKENQQIKVYSFGSHRGKEFQKKQDGLTAKVKEIIEDKTGDYDRFRFRFI